MVLLVSFLAFNGFCQATSEIEQIDYLVQNDSLRLIKIFKNLHANPELGFMEVRTTDIVNKDLEGLGFKTITHIGITGVVGNFENGNGPIVKYRGDMDCNAVKETTGLPYASTKELTKEDDTKTLVRMAAIKMNSKKLL